MFAAGVAAVLAAVPTHASGEETQITTGLGISIPRVVRIREVSPFEPRYAVGGDGTATEEALPTAYAAEVSVLTNAADWGVVVRFTLPQGGQPTRGSVAPRCRLEDGDDHVVSEQLVENGEVFLQGNGRRGSHTVFLEVDSLLETFGVEVLTEPVVELEGRLATEERADRPAGVR